MASKPEKINLLRVVSEYLMLKEVLKKEEVQGILSGKVPSGGASAFRDEKTLKQMYEYVNAVGQMKIAPRGIGKPETFDEYVEKLKENFIKRENAKSPKERIKYSENPFEENFINLVGGMIKMENAEERIRAAISYNADIAEKISSLPVLLGGKKQSTYIKLLAQYSTLYSDISYLQNELSKALENGKAKDARIQELENQLEQKTAEFEKYKHDVEQLLKADSKSEEVRGLVVVLSQTVENLDARLSMDVAVQGRATRKHITREADRAADRVINEDLPALVNKIRAQIRKNPNKYRTYITITQGKYIKNVDPAYREIELAAESVGVSKNSAAVEALKNDIHDKNYGNNEYARQTPSGSNAKKFVGGFVLGALVFGGAAGVIGYSLGNNTVSQPQNISESHDVDEEIKAHLQNENDQLEDYTTQLMQAVEEGTLISFDSLENAPTFGSVEKTEVDLNNPDTVKDLNYFKALRDKYAEDDQLEIYHISSTGEMDAITDLAIQTARANYYYDNYANLLSVVSSLNSQIESLKDELAQANADKAILQAEIDSLQAKIDELNAIIKAAEQENSELKAMVNKLQSEVNELRAENAALKNENTELRNENEQLKSQINDLNSQIEALINKINALKHENAVLSTEKAALQTQVARLEAQIAQLQQEAGGMSGEEKEELLEQIKELEEQLKEANETIEELRSTNEELTQTINDLNASISDLSSDITELENTVKELTAQNGALQEENEQLQAENEALREEIASVKASLAESIANYSDLLARYNELQNNGGNQDEINALRAELSSAYNKISAYETKIVNLYNSLTKSNTTNQEAMNDLEKLFEIFGIDYSHMGSSSYSSSNEYEPGL